MAQDNAEVVMLKASERLIRRTMSTEGREYILVVLRPPTKESSPNVGIE